LAWRHAEQRTKLTRHVALVRVASQARGPFQLRLAFLDSAHCAADAHNASELAGSEANVSREGAGEVRAIDAQRFSERRQ
jgi:hypothetical protein